MDIPNNKSINEHRIAKIKKDLLEKTSLNKENKDESDLLETLIDEIENELELDPKDIALAALNLVIGKSSLLMKADESWINQAERYNKGGERRDSRGRNRRRGPTDFNASDKDKERFRVEVGYRDRVKPGNIVGAIANESGLN